MADEAEDEKKDEGKSGKKTLLLIVAAFVLALVLGGGGVAAYFIFAGDASQDAEAAGQSTAKAEAIYTKVRTLEGKPMFVVSLQAEDRSPHYMQVYVEAKSRDQEIADALTLHMPLIVARLNALFSSRTLEELLSVEGKLQMQADALELVQNIIKEKTGKDGVEKILFTNLVMQ